MKEYKPKDLSMKPEFILPLKDHAVRCGHDCTMSCAFLGRPPPQASWYKGDVKISDGPRFWQSTANGVCTLTIPTCNAKDSGDYTLVLENPLGKAQCKCSLIIFDKDDKSILERLIEARKAKQII
ncbi:hypothetical protein COCON_G00217830 [Conger conger]|uniref:Ig-like domain-containing protein n=2 Tax=Conger conger TaxID=82655 RepID=A0A9Q1HPF5_CONCO|nr:hypothetical protein COCON_G00217830 [Conger conger]